MPVEVIMPKVDMDMTSGRIMAWHVAEGEAVTKGDPLFDIETDKAAMEVEAGASGLLHHRAPEGSEIAIGRPCAWIYAEDEEVGEPPVTFAAPVELSEPPDPEQSAAPDTPPATTARDATRAQAVPTAPDTENDKPRATPRARRLARDAGVAIETVPGSGPRGRIQAEDVAAALEQPAAGAPPTAFRPETGPLAVSHARGGTGTPVLLLHGFASDATSWAALEAHLKHRPRIRMDLPGHGKSPRLRIAGFAELVHAARAAFDAMNLDTVHLVGHSLGAAVAIALADTRPGSVASVTALAPAGLGPEINGAALAGICAARRAESLAPWLRTLVADETLITDSYVRLAMAARAGPNLRAAQAAMADTLFPDGVQSFDIRAALARLGAPTRLIWGRRDAIIPWRHALRAPGQVALHLFDGVGHMPQIEAADRIGALLRARV